MYIQTHSGIEVGTEFSAAITKILSASDNGLVHCVETGTNRGTGSTTVIAKALRSRPSGAKLWSIESNKTYAAQAVANLKAAKLLPWVEVTVGLSIPHERLLTMAEIQKQFVDAVPDADIFVDHEPAVRAQAYFAEANVDYTVSDGLLGRHIVRLNPGFILLDSAGHLGNIEFRYALRLLSQPCIIALDDTHHIKHAASLKQIKVDARFKMLFETDERYGACIAVFTPLPQAPDAAEADDADADLGD